MLIKHYYHEQDSAVANAIARENCEVLFSNIHFYLNQLIVTSITNIFESFRN